MQFRFARLTEAFKLRRHKVLSVAAILLFIVGSSLTVYGIATQESPPVPAMTAENRAEGGAPSSTAAENSDYPQPLDYSPPVHLKAPTIGVDSPLIKVGKNEDGTIEVPEGEQYDLAAWYRNSPSPGQYGPTIIEGHIDSKANGPSVFFELGGMKPGDEVTITRQDGVDVVYVIDEVRLYDREDFPTKRVYADFDNGPLLRLISCGGALNRDRGEYAGNIIAFGHIKADGDGDQQLPSS